MIVFKKYFFLVLFCLFATMSFAQLNVSYVGQYNYNTNLSDSWGYTDNMGNEYAIIGLGNGVSILDLSTPSNPVEVGFAPGFQSVWRDIKVWGDYAYVTCDQGSDGLMIIDMSNLPTGITYSFYRPELVLPSGTDTLNKAHNIWIDENGIAYISGANVGNRGVTMFDVATTPGTPIFVGAEDVEYAHDCYARGDTLYTADIYGGYFSIYDVSNKAAPVFLGSQTTPTLFTHNLWLSDNSNTIFTTDEKANAYVGAYDISDPSNVVELDRFRPDSTLGTGVIPHNVHVWDDFLIVSYYTDGCILVDASRPHNLIEVGNFDTYIPPTTGFQGVWGAYPYFASGLIVVSDIGNGAYVLQPNYVRACYLEGKVTDASTGGAINEASVKILNTLRNEETDISGDYATGYAVSGIYDVEYSAPGYQPQTISTTLSNGVLNTQDVQLQPLTAFALNGNVTEMGIGTTIDGAIVRIYNDSYDYETTTNTTGDFNFGAFYPGDYDIVIGKWGYKMTALSNETISLNSSALSYTLAVGYEDNFALDLGWLTLGAASAGSWQRGIPNGTLYNGNAANPGNDISTDFGEECYVTGNNGTSGGDDDVDNGIVHLRSPVFDVANYNDPYLTYHTWFFNDGGNGNPNDELTVSIHDGTQKILVETISQSASNWSAEKKIRISDFITPTANMYVAFETSDLQGSGHIVEAAVDMFTVFDSTAVNVNNLNQVSNSLLAAPNPSSTDFTIVYNLQDSYKDAKLHIYNAVGQLVQELNLNNQNGFVVFGEQLTPGVYVAQLIVDGEQKKNMKLVKNK